MQYPDNFPLERPKVDQLTVQRYAPDVNDLAWCTFSHLVDTVDFGVENPGHDEGIVSLCRIFLCNRRVYLLGTIYANPCGTVATPTCDNQFIKQARQLQREWLAQFNNILHSSQRVKGEMQRVHPLIKQLTLTGILFIDNRHVFPHQWPDEAKVLCSEERQKHLDPGTRFGHLIVIKNLAQAKLLCRCDCGNVVVKHRRHVASGRTKSCGCAQAKLHERQKNRRRDRGWKHTGVI